MDVPMAGGMPFIQLTPQVITTIRCPKCKKQMLEHRDGWNVWACTNCDFLVHTIGKHV